MNINIEYLEEPKLQFGNYFEHEDKKTGLAEFGPFGKNVSGLHKSEINIGFVGTRETISGAKEWLEECNSPIESENIQIIRNHGKNETENLFNNGNAKKLRNIRYMKIMNPDFVGFSKDTTFNCCFNMNNRWEKAIKPNKLDEMLNISNKKERIWKLVDRFEEEIKTLASIDPTPDIIILALTPDIIEKAHSVKISKNFYLNFRRAIKARAMKWDIPIQLLQKRTVTGRGKDIQEKATRAWNFCTALYYKAGGTPWKPLTLESDVCYVGISFYITQETKDNLTIRSSIAQAFDYLGQGLVLRGEPFEWDIEKHGITPHLTKNNANKLIKDILKSYVNIIGLPPRRVVIHKSSDFWGNEHEEYNELDGFYEGIEEVFSSCETDFVTLRQPGIRMFREGRYPPLRGTYFCIEESQHFLYTMGFIPYLETYPGSFIPEPWQIAEHHGGSAPKDIFREILALTKMNVNNCAFADGTPITLSFSQMIGEIMKHIPEDGIVQPKYKFYM